MTAPATADDFLDTLRRGKVIDDARLAAFLKKVGPDQLPDDPDELAELLLDEDLLTDYQAAQALEGKPLKLGPYRILDRLGFGAADPIYLCQHLAKGDRVAIKVLTESKAHDAVALQRFFREARAGTRLEHPNLVKVFDSDWDGDTHYLVMEYVDGCRLADIVARSGPLPVARAAHYIRQAAQGLQYAHEQGLVHRNLKPANLLVDRGGVVKILDMGLARFAKEEAEVLTKGVVLGEPEYLAPEQAVDSHNVDIRADIYSLGAVFYYLLTGTAPYSEEESAAQKVLAKQTRMPTPVRTLRPEVPQEIDVLIQIMMAQQPSVRYGTPKEVVDALAKWTRGPVPAPTPDELPPRVLPSDAVPEPEVTANSDTSWPSLPELPPESEARVAVAAEAAGAGDEAEEEEAVAPVPAAAADDAIPLPLQVAAFVALGALTFAAAWFFILKDR